MTWSLTAKSGSSRGESWMIGAKPVVLGRSLSCDIAIGDPTVSRRHCEVKLEGDGVFFRDLGSRNITLVNGRAVESCRLLVGDELSLGSESFILTRTIAAVPAPPIDADAMGDTTVSLDSAMLLRESHSEASPSNIFPATVQELLRLFHFGRKLGKAIDETAFATLCIDEMEEVFPARIKPSVCCWRVGGLSWYPAGFAPSEDLLAQTMDVMNQGEAAMTSFRAKRLFFKELVIAGTAPLMVAGRCHGALVIQSVAKDYIPEPGALARLSAMAQTASPYLGSLMNRKESAHARGFTTLSESETTHDAAQGARQDGAAKNVDWLKWRVLRERSSASERQAVLEPLENAERTLLTAVLAQCNGDAQVAANILGLPVSTLEGLTTAAKRPRSEEP